MVGFYAGRALLTLPLPKTRQETASLGLFMHFKP